MRRLLSLVTWSVAGAVALASPASAKMPPFTVEVRSASDRENGDVSIRVVLDDGFSGFDAADLDGLVAAFPRSSLTTDLRPRIDARGDAVAIQLELVAPFTYDGVVRLPELGESWIIVPFPSSTVAAQELVDNGYPPSVRVERTAAQESKRSWWLLGAGAIAVGSLGLLRYRRRGRAAAATTSA